MSASKLTGLARAVQRGLAKPIDGVESADDRRRLVAAYCRMLADRRDTTQTPPAPPPDAVSEMPTLPRRLRQTLDLLLAGDGEKQIAYKLKLSPHTIHVYIKSLHKKFGVSSRSELLARFITPPAAASIDP